MMTEELACVEEMSLITNINTRALKENCITFEGKFKNKTSERMN